MAAWPNLAAVRTYLRLQPEPTQDQVIGSALAAAIAYGVKRYIDRTGAPIYPPDATSIPDNAYEACLKHAARLYQRRNSIDGTIGLGDMGAIRVGRYDADIDALYAQDAPLVFG